MVLNQIIFHLALPALILTQFHEVVFDSRAVFPVLMPWALFAMSYAFFHAVGGFFQLTRKQVGALILTGGLANTSFVGFPLLEALYGPEAIPVGMLSDQFGTFLILSTLGLAVASQFAGAGFSWRAFTRRVLKFPPVYALVLAIALRPVPFSPAFEEVLIRLAGMITPLAMVSVGFQLRLSRRVLNQYRSKLILGLVFKLVLAPLVFLCAARFFFGVIGRDTQVTLLESAMAPMISAGILASEFGLDEELAGLMVGVGILLSLATVPLFAWWLG